MRKVLTAIGVALALSLPAGWVLSQAVAPVAISGNECWSVGQGPGGPSSFLCINTARNGRAMALISGSGAATTAMVAGQSTLMWTGTAPTTWAVTLPVLANCFDGMIVTLGTDTTLTTMVTVTAGAGTTLSATYASQTLTAVTSVSFQYNASGTKWYRLT
jgi:hypothetical protein